MRGFNMAYILESRRPQSGASSSAGAPPFNFGSLPSLPSFTRLFPVSGSKCTTGNGDVGVCLSQTECDNQGGIKDGNCGTILFNSAGACCSCKTLKTVSNCIDSQLSNRNTTFNVPSLGSWWFQICCSSSVTCEIKSLLTAILFLKLIAGSYQTYSWFMTYYC